MIASSSLLITECRHRPTMSSLGQRLSWGLWKRLVRALVVYAYYTPSARQSLLTRRNLQQSSVYCPWTPDFSLHFHHHGDRSP